MRLQSVADQCLAGCRGWCAVVFSVFCCSAMLACCCCWCYCCRSAAAMRLQSVSDQCLVGCRGWCAGVFSVFCFCNLVGDRKHTSMVSIVLSADIARYLSQHQPHHTSGGGQLLLCHACLLLLLVLLPLLCCCYAIAVCSWPVLGWLSWVMRGCVFCVLCFCKSVGGSQQQHVCHYIITCHIKNTSTTEDYWQLSYSIRI